MLVPQRLGPGVQLDESFPNGQDSSLCAVVDLQLMENISHMILDGLFAQVQVIGDFLVVLPSATKRKTVISRSVRSCSTHPGFFPFF